MRNWVHRIERAKSLQRVAKAELLPLSRQIRDVLSLEYHLQLEALRVGSGSLMALQVLMRVALASRMLKEMGYGQVEIDMSGAYEESASRAYVSGRDGSFRLDEAGCDLFSALVTAHDRQLEAAPVRAIALIAERIEAGCQTS